MVNVAVLGYGVVGSGVVEVIKRNRQGIREKAGEDIQVSKILDIRDFPDSPDKDLLTKNAEEIFNNDSIGIVAETIGGAGIAYEFTKRAIKAGKHVVTSNKELVARHGPELLALAMDHGVNYLFEASVGGGIPIIRPLNRCLAANDIAGILGILNGTTNYILTQMRREGKDFAEALKEAQQKGYAEADPTADIEGHDACRKIAILSSIAYNEYVDYQKILTEGISRISLVDMKYAEVMNSVIKLVAESRKIEDKIYARVGPAIVNKENPLANVEDVFNAIVVKGNAVGDTMFYGRGAGKLPTASAVVADIMDIVKHENFNGWHLWKVSDQNNVAEPLEGDVQYFVRLKVNNGEQAKKLVHQVFGMVEWIEVSGSVPESEIAFITDIKPEKQLRAYLKEIEEIPVEKVENVIRVLQH